MPLRGLLRRAPLRQRHDTTAEGLRDLLLETRVAERPAPVRCGAQVPHEIPVQRAAKQRAILPLAKKISSDPNYSPIIRSNLSLIIVSHYRGSLHNSDPNSFAGTLDLVRSKDSGLYGGAVGDSVQDL